MDKNTYLSSTQKGLMERNEELLACFQNPSVISLLLIGA